jgi:superfamily II DNA/RNA helicase
MTSLVDALDASLDLPARSVVDSTPTVTFADLGLPAEMVAQLNRSGMSAPFAIQAAVIPDALAGRDIAGRAPTGSGKTLGFGLPLVAGLTQAKPKRPSSPRSRRRCGCTQRRSTAASATAIRRAP